MPNGPDDKGMHHYAVEGSATVPGWLLPTDAELFGLVDRVQKEQGTRGHLLEIGVFKGKSATLLGYFPRPGETLYVCDIFEGAEVNVESVDWRTIDDIDKPSKREFLANYRRFHDSSPEVLEMPSNHLDAGALGERSFRFLHVDGAHDWENVVADVELTRRLSGAGAVVVFDDMTLAKYPGVAAAVWEAVVHGGLRPLLLSEKLYATWDPDDALADALYDAVDATGRFVVHEHRIAATSVRSVTRREDPTGSAAPRIKGWARDVTPPALYKFAHRVRRNWEDRRDRTRARSG